MSAGGEGDASQPRSRVVTAPPDFGAQWQEKDEDDYGDLQEDAIDERKGSHNTVAGAPRRLIRPGDVQEADLVAKDPGPAPDADLAGVEADAAGQERKKAKKKKKKAKRESGDAEHGAPAVPEAAPQPAQEAPPVAAPADAAAVDKWRERDEDEALGGLQEDKLDLSRRSGAEYSADALDNLDEDEAAPKATAEAAEPLAEEGAAPAVAQQPKSRVVFAPPDFGKQWQDKDEDKDFGDVEEDAIREDRGSKVPAPAAAPAATGGRGFISPADMKSMGFAAFDPAAAGAAGTDDAAAFAEEPVEPEPSDSPKEKKKKKKKNKQQQPLADEAPSGAPAAAASAEALAEEGAAPEDQPRQSSRVVLAPPDFGKQWQDKDEDKDFGDIEEDAIREDRGSKAPAATGGNRGFISPAEMKAMGVEAFDPAAAAGADAPAFGEAEEGDTQQAAAESASAVAGEGKKSKRYGLHSAPEGAAAAVPALSSEEVARLKSELAESMETIVELDTQLRKISDEKEHFRNLAISNTQRATELDTQVAREHEACEGFARKAAEAEAALEAMRLELAAAKARAEEASAAASAQKNTLESLQRSDAQASGEVAKLREQLEQARAQLANRDKEIAALRAAAEGAKKDADEAVRARREAESREADASKGLRAEIARERTAASESARSAAAAKAEADSASREVVASRKVAEDSKRVAEQGIARVSALEEELASLRKRAQSDVDAAAARLKQLTQELEAAKKRATDAEAQLRVSEAKADELRAEGRRYRAESQRQQTSLIKRLEEELERERERTRAAAASAASASAAPKRASGDRAAPLASLEIDTATPSVRLEKLAAAVRSENRLSELFFLLFIVAFFGVIALPDWVLTVNR